MRCVSVKISILISTTIRPSPVEKGQFGLDSLNIGRNRSMEVMPIGIKALPPESGQKTIKNQHG
jgi:hypothetical protein